MNSCKRVVELIKQGFVKFAELRLRIGMVAVWADEEADDSGFAFHDGSDGLIAVLWRKVLQ